MKACYIMDLSLTPKTWDPSFPDLPITLAKHGFVFVNAVGKFYTVGGTRDQWNKTFFGII